MPGQREAEDAADRTARSGIFNSPPVVVGVIAFLLLIHEAERLVSIIARIIVDLADCEKRDLIIEFELIGDLGDAGLQHRGHAPCRRGPSN